MCGIYLTNIPLKISEVSSRLESIKFRGPDCTGVLQKDGLSFGHLRLSVIDLDERSNQPMIYKHYTIVYNGEIYNYKTIKNELETNGFSFETTGDTEVLLKAFDFWGEKMLAKLNGMFAFAIYDSVKQEVFCSRDRLGVKPFYYSWNNGVFEICSQLRPIAQNKLINEQAISIYLACGYIPSPHSVFDKVYKLLPGHVLKIDLKAQEKATTKYWDLKKVVPLKLSYSEAKNKLHDLLKDAVKIRLNADVTFGSFLSGGIDSALVSSIASNQQKKKLKTFSVGFEDKRYDESEVAKRYSSILGTAHTEILCNSSDVLKMLPKLIEVYDEPFADSSALPSLLLNKVTKRHVTMALSGDGGDESFLGYYHFDWVKKFEILNKVPFFIRVILSYIPLFGLFKHRKEIYKRILRTKTKNEFIQRIFFGFSTLLKKEDASWLNLYNDYSCLSQDILQNAADLNIKLWLENDSNVKVDRASMASSVEVRSPLLDYRVIEFARQLPTNYRYGTIKKKRILRDILIEYIPEEIFDQPKKGFSIPINDWIRGDLKDEFKINLENDFLNLIPNFDVKKFKKIFANHLENKGDYGNQIWRVYLLSKWYQEFGFYKS